MKSQASQQGSAARNRYVARFARARFEKKWIGVVTVLLLALGVVGIVATRAQVVTDAVVVIADAQGGFRNSIQVIEPASNNIVGQLTATLPTLSGCPAAQPRAYLDDLALLPGSKAAYASVRACPGGILPDGQALARFDAATGKFVGLMQGPGSGSVLYVMPGTATLIIVSADGRRIQSVDASSGRVLAQVTLANNYAATRWGAGPNGILMLLDATGKAVGLNPVTLEQRELGQLTGIDFARVPSAPDTQRLEMVGDSVYTVGKVGGEWVLASRNAAGQASQSKMGAQPVSLLPNPTKDHIFVATGCPTSVGCVSSPNRIYAYSIEQQKFEQGGNTDYIPLQMTPYLLRFNSAGTRIFFDGIVSGSNGVAQRFVYSLAMNSVSMETARIAIPGGRWEIASVDIPTSPPVSVPVPPGVASGGGIGPNTGTLAQSPVPIDEIERLLGMSLSQIDFSTITDDQIRAFGYDPAAVRRYVAQWQYAQQATGQSVAGCQTVTLSPELQALQQKVGVSLAMIDASRITDDQIRAFGYEPQAARKLLGEYQEQTKSQATCSANTFTQEGFVASGQTEVEGLPAGTVANPTVQTTFDLLKGGWLMRLRWQTPGGAKKFVIYGRDESKHTREQKLAVIDGSVREVSFGGFGRLGLPALWHDERYTLAVVPEKDTAIMGVPSAVKVRVRCIAGWCFTGQ